MIQITRDNLEELLDKRLIYCAINNGSWWALRRNGKTQTWKKDPSRIRIPFKYGLKGTGAFTESDLCPALPSQYYRHQDDVPASPRRGR